MSSGVVYFVDNTNSQGTSPSIEDDPQDGLVAMVNSLTSSVDTDVTWTHLYGDRWRRSETRPV